MMRYRKKINKHKSLMSVTLILILTIYIFSLRFSSIKYKNVDYAIEKYMTSGLFNNYRLYSMKNYKIKFSDGITCIAEVNGIEDKRPYKTVKYNIHLKKNKSGIWKLSKIDEMHDNTL